MIEKLLKQVREKDHRIIYHEYNEHYGTFRVLKHKIGTTIIWKEKYDVDEYGILHHVDSSLAHFDC